MHTSSGFFQQRERERGGGEREKERERKESPGDVEECRGNERGATFDNKSGRICTRDTPSAPGRRNEVNITSRGDKAGIRHKATGMSGIPGGYRAPAGPPSRWVTRRGTRGGGRGGRRAGVERGEGGDGSSTRRTHFPSLTSSWLSSLMAIGLSRPLCLPSVSELGAATRPRPARLRGLFLAVAPPRFTFSNEGDGNVASTCGVHARRHPWPRYVNVRDLASHSTSVFAFGRGCSGLAPSHGQSLAASSTLQNS